MLTRRRTLALAGALALVVSACGPTAPSTQSAASAATPVPLRKIQIELASKGAPYVHFVIAMEKGYYAQEGLELEVVYGSGSALAAADLPFSTAGSTALSAILRGAPQKIIFTNLDRPGYELWSGRPEIRTLADLAGKSVGINNRGDTMEVSARLVLQKAGVDPNAVAFTPLSSGQTRLAAVQSGAIDASILGISDVQRLKQTGPKGHLLADVARDVRMLFNGIGTSDQLIRENPALVKGFIRATVRGREYLRAYKEETLEVLARTNGAGREVNEPDYDSVYATMTEDGTFPEEIQLADARVRADLIGVTAMRPFDEIYDNRFAREVYAELRQSGWKPQR